MMNAEGLAHIMNDLFGNVVYADIDTDKHKYPIGEYTRGCGGGVTEGVYGGDER